MNWLTELKRLIRQLSKQGLRLTLLAGFDKLVRMFGNRPAGRYNRITPKIILGGQPAPRHLVRLAQAGVTGIINMRDEYTYKEEVGDTNLSYLYLPTIDNTAPTLEQLHQGVEFIQQELAEGGSVYIHCWEGLGRGPTMVAAYFASIGETPEEAWAKIRASRPFIRPTDTQMAIIRDFAESYVPVPPTPATPEEEVKPEDVEVAGVEEIEEDANPAPEEK